MEKKSNVGLYIIITILIVALTVAVCYIVFNKSNDNQMKEQSKTVEKNNNDSNVENNIGNPTNDNNKSTTQNINEKNEIVLTEVQKSKFENYDKIFININANMLDVSDQINKTDYLVYNINLFDNPDSRFYFAFFTIDNCSDGYIGEGSKECDLNMFKNYYNKLFNKEFKEDEVRVWQMDKIENNKIYGTLPSGYSSGGVWNELNKIMCNDLNECDAIYDLNNISFDNELNEIKTKVGEGKLSYIQNNDGTITIKSYIITK